MVLPQPTASINHWPTRAFLILGVVLQARGGDSLIHVKAGPHRMPIPTQDRLGRTDITRPLLTKIDRKEGAKMNGDE